MLAEVNASATCQSNPATQNGVGFLNPLLYSVASNPTAYAASFNDIKVGNNDAYGDSNLFHATSGYDMASGLGTPQLTQPGGGAGLAFYLCSQAPAVTRPTVTQLSPSTGFTSAPEHERDDHRLALPGRHEPRRGRPGRRLPGSRRLTSTSATRATSRSRSPPPPT